MKNLPGKFVIALIMVFVVPFSGYATDLKQQDHQQDKGTTEGETKETTPVIFEEDTKVRDAAFDYSAIKSAANQVETKQPTAYKPYVPKPQETEKLEAEVDQNSAMSFNFIYYIIDKFKFNDPLD